MPTVESVELCFKGPAKIFPDDSGDPLFIQVPEAWKPGIYLWSFKGRDFNRINYVGIATKAMAERQVEHLSLFLTGQYTFYQSNELFKGRLQEAFHTGDGLGKFQSQMPDLITQLQMMRIFFASCDVKKNILERIESALIYHLREQGGAISTWLANERVSRKNLESEAGIECCLRCPESLAGLPNVISA